MPQVEYDDGCKDGPNPGALILFWVAVAAILAASFYAGNRLWWRMRDRRQQHTPNRLYSAAAGALPSSGLPDEAKATPDSGRRHRWRLGAS
jgi:hypothetical protein